MSMHKFFIVKLHKPTKLKKTGLTIMTEAAAKFAVQCRCSLTLVKSLRIYTGQYTFPILLLNDNNMLGERKGREKNIVYGRLF